MFARTIILISGWNKFFSKTCTEHVLKRFEITLETENRVAKILFDLIIETGTVYNNHNLRLLHTILVDLLDMISLVMRKR